MDFSWISNPEGWAALATLTLLELVLGIDNILFISILASRAPKGSQQRTRTIGLALAMLARIVLLFSLAWLIGLSKTLFTVVGMGISARDMVLIGGGLFLIAKATLEIHNALESAVEERRASKAASVWSILLQIMMIDLVFSIDSVITAVGMVEQISIMVIAIVISVIVMMLAMSSISQFIEKHPTIKMLALSFLVVIGVVLIADGIDLHVPRGYIYFAMAFSCLVEMLNIRLVRGRAPVKLHKRMRKAAPSVETP